MTSGGDLLLASRANCAIRKKAPVFVVIVWNHLTTIRVLLGLFSNLSSISRYCGTSSLVKRMTLLTVSREFAVIRLINVFRISSPDFCPLPTPLSPCGCPTHGFSLILLHYTPRPCALQNGPTSQTAPHPVTADLSDISLLTHGRRILFRRQSKPHPLNAIRVAINHGEVKTFFGVSFPCKRSFRLRAAWVTLSATFSKPPTPALDTCGARPCRASTRLLPCSSRQYPWLLGESARYWSSARAS